jgi:hypothetical protein
LGPPVDIDGVGTASGQLRPTGARTRHLHDSTGRALSASSVTTGLVPVVHEEWMAVMHGHDGSLQGCFDPVVLGL